MTMRLDIVTNDAGELVRREHARDLGANVVLAIYRLAKLAQLHDLANQAFQRQLEQTHAAVVEYGLRAGTNVNILFAQKAVFVAGQLLKGNRATYEQASELGDIMEWCGGSELLVQRDVTPQELHQFGEAISVALRSEKGRGYKAPSPRIRLRAVADAARLRGLEIEALSPDQRVVRTYASAVVIMRRFFEDLATSHYILPRRIKRVAQSLVDLSDGSTPAFLGVTEVRNQNHDAAGRAVNTAILAVTMAREVTDDRVLLAQIAMAAMMHDVGRPRAAALSAGGMGGIAAKVSEDAEDKLAAGTAAILTALGRVNEPTIRRTVVAYEALWLRRQKFLGPVYRAARLPTIHAKILQIARRYNDLLTPEPGLAPPTSDFAIATLADEMPDPADRTILRMLVAALGLFPAGTVVHLSSNEVAEVVGSSAERAAPPDLPVVRLVMDARGGVVERVVEVDLANPRPGEPSRRIAKVVSIDGWQKGLEYAAKRTPSQGSGTRPKDDDDPVGWSHPGGASEPPSASVPSIASLHAARAARETAASNPSAPSGSGVVEISRDGSYPSAGTSPSMVAEAMGRVMADGAVNPPLPRVSRSTGSLGAAVPSVDAAPFSSKAVAVGSPSTAAFRDLTPSARGTLASTPIVHVLVYMLDHIQTGSVVLREPDGAHHIFYFHEGSPSKIRLGKPLALLGEQLFAEGLVDSEVMAKAIENSRRMDTLLGEFLVDNGLLTLEMLAAELATQVALKLAAIVNLPPETDYAFYGGVNLLDSWAGGELSPCHPLNAILSSVRAWHDRARIRATLGRIAKQPLGFHPESDLSALILTREEQSVLDAIAATRSTVTTLYQQRVADEEIVSSLVYTLAVTRCFGFTTAKGPPMASPVFPRNGQHEGHAIEVDMGAGSVGPAVSLPPMSALGVATTERPLAPSNGPPPSGGAPPFPAHEQARPAATAWRPARVPVTDVVDPHARQANTVPSPAMGSAPRSIRPEPRRDTVQPKAFPVSKPPPSVPVPSESPDPLEAADPQDEAERALEAMADFRKADTALQRNDLAMAERLAKKAVEGDPENAEYRSLLSWLTALSGKKEAVKEALHGLNEVLKDDALCERALLYRGKLLKRENRHSEALRDFMTVLDVNPKNNEAASEVRLLRMQKKK
jgi:HD-GYP domain-containing protein (c-di-GMP phosphodiesterase class II)